MKPRRLDARSMARTNATRWPGAWRKLASALLLLTSIALAAMAAPPTRSAALRPIIRTIAGNGTSGNSGAGGPATSAELNLCSNSGYGTTCGSSIAQDAQGNIYLPEEGNNIVQVLAEASSSPFLPGVALTPGYIYTLAGTGTAGYTGDGAPARFAELDGPSATAIDQSGNLVIADFYNAVVRLVAATSSDSLFPGKTLTPGDIYTIAGGATSSPCTGNGCVAATMRFGNTSGVAIDPGGNLVLVDMGDNDAWLLAATSSDPLLPGTSLTAGELYRVAGDETFGYGGNFGPAPQAELAWPFGAAFDASGNLYLSDTRNGAIRLVAARTSDPLIPGVALVPGDIYTVAGNSTQGYAGDGGPAIDAEIDQALNSPGDTSAKYGGVVLDGSGNLYIPDASNEVVRLVAAAAASPLLPEESLAAGDIYTTVGSGKAGYGGDGEPTCKAELYGPSALAFNAAGNMLVLDGGNGALREVVGGQLAPCEVPRCPCGPPRFQLPSPTISGASFASRSFTADRGTKLRLTLSEAATIVVAITQIVPGRKAHGRCRAHAKHGRRCARLVHRRTLTFAGVAGENVFSLKLRGLHPGRYEASIAARNAAGRSSNEVLLNFTITAPRHSRQGHARRHRR